MISRRCYPRLPELSPNSVTGISTQAMMDQMHPKPVLAPLNAAVAGQRPRRNAFWTRIAAAALLVLLVACAKRSKPRHW